MYWQRTVRNVVAVVHLTVKEFCTRCDNKPLLHEEIFHGTMVYKQAFYAEFGQPWKTMESLEGETYQYYKCSDGIAEVKCTNFGVAKTYLRIANIVKY
jgi:hypothetical protein